MTTYPIEMSRVTLTYQDGARSDKFYELTLYKVADGRTGFLQRWGKNGSFGQMKFTPWSTFDSAERDFEKVLRTKTGKGYRTSNQIERKAETLQELKTLAGIVLWPQLPPSFFTELGIEIDPEDLAKRKELREVKYDKITGKPIVERKTLSAEQLREAARIKQEQDKAEVAETYAQNALFGAF